MTIVLPSQWWNGIRCIRGPYIRVNVSSTPPNTIPGMPYPKLNSLQCNEPTMPMNYHNSCRCCDNACMQKNLTQKSWWLYVFFYLVLTVSLFTNSSLNDFKTNCTELLCCYVCLWFYCLILIARQVFVSSSLLSPLSLSPRVLFSYDLFLCMVDPSIWWSPTHLGASRLTAIRHNLSLSLTLVMLFFSCFFAFS